MNDCADDMIMPFGKFKGESVGDIPISYLEWLYDNVELRGNLQQAVYDAIEGHYAMEQRRGRVVK